MMAYSTRRPTTLKKNGQARSVKNASIRQSPPAGKAASATGVFGADGPTVKGNIIALTDAGVLGWAWDPADPRRAVPVSIMDGDMALGAGLADIFDHELVRQRAGPGIPGFLVRPTRQPQGKYPITLTLKVDNGPLIGAPLIVDDPAQLEAVSDAALYEGFVDGLHNGAVIGWIWSPNLPTRRVAVEIWDGEERIDRTIASIHRKDLAKGDGCYGFRFELPLALLDGQFHALRVRVPNSEYEIPHGAINIGSTTASILLTEVVSLRAEVDRLAKLVEQVTSPHGEFQSQVIRVLSERVAALSEIQREVVERELEALRSFAFETRKPTAATVSQPEPHDAKVVPQENASRVSPRPQRRGAARVKQRPSVVSLVGSLPET